MTETQPAADLKQLAIQDETQAAMEAAMAHLQNRVVALNVEVRTRDAQIAALEAQVAECASQHGGAESSAPEPLDSRP